MSEEFGLSLGENAPLFDTVDVFENQIKLKELLKRNRGILIDFSRGAW